MAYTRQQVFDLIAGERLRQIEKHGEQDNNTDEQWLAILVEEVGEAAKAVLEGRPRFVNMADAGHSLEEEIIHVAAVAVSWLEKRGGR